jgi:hypothetical protein
MTAQIGNMSGRGSETTSILPQIADLLPSVGDYLLESVFGIGLLTVTMQHQRLSQQLSLATVASHVQQLPITFMVSRDDIPASLMVDTAYMLSVHTVKTLSFGETAATVTLHSNDIDRQIWQGMRAQIIPSRAEENCGYVRRRIHLIAAHIKPCDSWQALLRQLARPAGCTFEQAAESLIKGGECLD